jgi:putative nucleotidyltransferase with HDIG domain
MIKKVKVKDLKVGVYVHDFNCEWNSENLYIEKALIQNEYTIDILKTWGIREVFIDTERGLDVETSKAPPEVKKEAREALLKIGQTTSKGQKPEVPLSRELQPAKEIVLDAVALIQQANQLVEEGKSPDIGRTYDLANKMKESINRNRDALLLLTRIRNKDEYTLYHSISVSSHVLNMCRYLKTPDYQSLDLAVGALFHDIGKTIVSEKILKKPDKLDKEEYREIQRHVEYSVNLLQNAKGLPLECYDIALHHHERFDGSGYPKGLKGDQISHGSQLTCICDVFDAITSERCYKDGVDTVTGLRKIYEGREKFFSIELANDFIRCLGVYPIGTYVTLGDGRSGVVVSSTEDILQPVVQVFFNEKKKERLTPQKVDLSRTGGTIVSYGDPEKSGFTAQQLLRKMVSQDFSKQRPSHHPVH